ncbi:hypothetical protein K3495_g13988 [Podosphaera aphanis]|nr:hypothetical protein K3495_g13988 [Podosphaera aphanis]
MKFFTILIGVLPIIGSVSATQSLFVPQGSSAQVEQILCLNRQYERVNFEEKIVNYRNYLAEVLAVVQVEALELDFVPKQGDFQVPGPYFRVAISETYNDFVILNSEGVIAGAAMIDNIKSRPHHTYQRCVLMLSD